MHMRIGNGYDVHRFDAEPCSDGFLTIGGVCIPHTHVLLAHSDGDVLVHALCDALLGALALGDIGQHFPDSDARYKGVSSMLLLRQVMDLVRQRGWQLVNADMTLVAQAPRFSPHMTAIRAALATALAVASDQVSVKATTTEGLGFTGRKEGIACYAVVLLGQDAAR
jgi:2-C-methyl-D-erythritol 2,4-cyclodiphosphate synthase